MTGPFDPRRLADLAARPMAAPASAVPVPAAPGPAAPALPGAIADVPMDGAGPTGHRHVDAVLAELERAEQLPPDQQIPAYEAVHRTLQETLRSIEQN
ncbi:hypothetical protein [Planosporangium mesophilum]|uniref:Uncharacterized protein n=1 Tax=Planosporangium mesophilum TaxID=689768 RepID=A0A8J3X1B4_9ACTN|nr:hypothetical protein [Planosporangium mesophilum]GII23149.1 hypothetical protein Pme01_27460 [Planosporangium mesophilum]